MPALEGGGQQLEPTISRSGTSGALLSHCFVSACHAPLPVGVPFKANACRAALISVVMSPRSLSRSERTGHRTRDAHRCGDVSVITIYRTLKRARAN